MNDVERNQAPLLYAVIADVSKKVPNYTRWKEAVSEFINLTTLCQPEPHTSKKKVFKTVFVLLLKSPFAGDNDAIMIIFCNGEFI